MDNVDLVARLSPCNAAYLSWRRKSCWCVKSLTNASAAVVPPTRRRFIVFAVQNHGSRPSDTDVTFVVNNEDHTIGNAVRYVLMRRYAATPCVCRCGRQRLHFPTLKLVVWSCCSCSGSVGFPVPGRHV